jgi:type I restriction-modification system DNA methylase subunit
MNNNDLNRIANFIWSIVDDDFQDISVHDKYRDVILPIVACLSGENGKIYFG